MIYIGNHAESGRGIYLDIHSTMRRGGGEEISAIIGDGFYEGEILILSGPVFDVTFVDALWGDAGALKDFFERHGKDKVLADLSRVFLNRNQSMAKGAGLHVRQPHVFLPLFNESIAACAGE